MVKDSINCDYIITWGRNKNKPLESKVQMSLLVEEYINMPGG